MLTYNNPVKIIITNDWILNLKESLVELEIFNPIIFTTPGNKNRLKVGKLFKENSIFTDFTPNPNFKECEKVIDHCQNKDFDGIVAIGGGSAMDIAKLAKAYICLNNNNVKSLISFSEEYPKDIPSVFIPTTHGTASEVTKWATLWNMEEKRKYSLSHEALYPNIAIIDGSTVKSLPLDISITSLLDALSHSLESIWNNNANKTSTAYAIKAICMILKNVDMLKNDTTNLEVRNNLLLASNIAGLAFSNTATAAAHSISYPLTIHYDIPHGIACSMTLIPLLKINLPYIKKSIHEICEKLECSFEELNYKIEKIPHDIIPFSLQDWGVEKYQLDKLAEESFTKGRMDNNVKKLSKSEVRELLELIY